MVLWATEVTKHERESNQSFAELDHGAKKDEGFVDLVCSLWMRGNVIVIVKLACMSRLVIAMSRLCSSAPHLGLTREDVGAEISRKKTEFE